MYALFCRLLLQQLQAELPSSADVEFAENAGVRTVSIRTEADLLWPRITLDGFYEEYRRGRSVREISGRILEIYAAETLQPFLAPGDIPDRETFLRGLGLRPVSRRLHQKLMPLYPHVLRHGLLFFHTFSLPDAGSVRGGMILTREMQEHFRVSDDTLFRRALSNEEEAAPAVIVPLETFLERLARDGALPRPVFSAEKTEGSIYVLSNKDAFLGANAILYPGVPEALCRHFGPCFLLPSSVHEMLILPRKDAGDPAELRRLIRFVNRTLCDSLLVLSDDLYVIDPEKGVRVYDALP